jgi:uncharacterized protein (TIGR02117 family)
LVILLVLLLAGCAARADPLNSSALEAPPKAIYVVSHGWHTGIVIARADLPDDWPGLQDFARSDYLEFGWGDAEFYPAEEGTVWLALKALLWPTPSVLHVAGISGSVTTFFPKSRLVRIRLTESGFVRMLRFIRDMYWLSADGRAIPVAAGLYGEGKFYQARGKFYFPKTCNYWTLSALREAGLPVIPLFAVTGGGVLSQVERHGELIQK